MRLRLCSRGLCLGTFLISLATSVMLALSSTPTSAQLPAGSQGSGPATKCGVNFCFCEFGPVFGASVVEIRNVTIGATLPIGTRVLSGYLATEGGFEDHWYGEHYLSNFREVFLSSGQYVSLNQSLVVQS